ncbi:MAG TPA: transglycosylase domain-containing protein [Ktedonobacterales bacterium]
MGRDSRGGSYDDDQRGGGGPRENPYGRPSRASGERSVPPNPTSRTGMTRGRSAPSDPRSDPNGRRNGSGGLIRPAGPPDGGYDGPPRRASRPGDTPPRGPRADSGRQPRAPRGEDYDDGNRGTGSYSTRGRSVGERARDLSKSMSRQLSSMMESARGAMRGQRGGAPGRGESGYAPSVAMGAVGPETPGENPLPSYRRSRLRLRARKWRLGRRNPHAMWYAIGFALTAALIVSLLGAGGGGAFYAVSYYNQHQADIAAVASSAAVGSTTIYDRNGNVLYTVPKATGVNIYLSYGNGPDQGDISSKVINATVATEDHTFWDATNIGIDWTSIFRSLLVDASSGGAAQGGSTITQQLVKNLVLHDRTKAIQRKINEAILSIGITESGTYPKWKILEMYLNTIDYSDGNLGIEAAAENYFGLQPIKDTTKCGTVTFAKPRTCWANQQLDWAQIAMLVGVPNAPTEFKPSQFSCDAPSGKNVAVATACPISSWDNPCIGDPNDLLNAQCYPDGIGPDGFHYTSSGHEWLVYRRAAVVLDSLHRYGYIDQATYDSSLAEVKSILLNHKVGSHLGGSAGAVFGVTKLAPHFVDYVLDDVLPNDFGIQDPNAEGIRVYTTLDLALDEYAITRAQYYIEKPHTLEWPNYAGGCSSCIQPSLANSANIHNTAEVAMDPRTGDILAMVGSVDYTSLDAKVKGFYNVAISPNRSMGSSTKPLVYATAMQMGWTPGMIMQDIPTCFPGDGSIIDPTTKKPALDTVAQGCPGYYVPHNYDAGSFSGHIPLRYALANSLNVPATQTMEFVGASPSTSGAFLAEAQRMGVTTLTKNNMGPSTALGTQNISLLQLTNAYAVFADQGKHVQPRSVLEILDPYGKVWYQAGQPQATQVLSPQVAYEMTSILSDTRARVPDFNFWNPLEFNDPNDPTQHGYTPDDVLGFPAVAAKTGTSQGINGPRDIVTMGYSPYMALGVWAGNSDSSDLNQHIIGIAGAGYIFHDIMEWAIKHYNWPKGTQFPLPNGMARGVFNCTSGLAPYAGQTQSQACDNQTDPQASQPMNIWAAYGYVPRPNEDWYLQGQQWVHS